MQAIQKQMRVLFTHKNGVLACIGMELVRATKADPTLAEIHAAQEALYNRSTMEILAAFPRRYARAWRKHTSAEIMRLATLGLMFKSTLLLFSGEFLWSLSGCTVLVGSFYVPCLPTWAYRGDPFDWCAADDADGED